MKRFLAWFDRHPAALIICLIGLGGAVGTAIPALAALIAAGTDGQLQFNNGGTIAGAGLGQGFVMSGTGAARTFNSFTPNRTATASTTIAAGDMSGQVNLNSAAMTLSIPAISTTVFSPGGTVITPNFNANMAMISSTPTINGCPLQIYSGGFAAFTSNGTSLDCFGFPGFGQFLNQANTFVSPQTFNEVHGNTYTPALTSNNYTLQASDCGKFLVMPAGTAGATVTLFSYNGSCTIRIDQAGANQYTVTNGGGATFNSVNSFTKTKGPHAVISLSIEVPSGSAAVWIFSGDGA